MSGAAAPTSTGALRTEVGDLAIEAPPGFRRERTTVCLRVPADKGLAEAPLKAPVRPSLVVERRPAPAGALLPACVARIQEELHRSVPGLSGIDCVDARFADGHEGVILGYSFPAPRVAEVVLCQLQAVRLDDAVLSTLTLTTTLAQLTESRRDQFIRILASARLAAATEGDPQ